MTADQLNIIHLCLLKFALCIGGVRRVPVGICQTSGKCDRQNAQQNEIRSHIWIHRGRARPAATGSVSSRTILFSCCSVLSPSPKKECVIPPPAASPACIALPKVGRKKRHLISGAGNQGLPAIQKNDDARPLFFRDRFGSMVPINSGTPCPNEVAQLTSDLGWQPLPADALIQRERLFPFAHTLQL